MPSVMKETMDCVGFHNTDEIVEKITYVNSFLFFIFKSKNLFKKKTTTYGLNIYNFLKKKKNWIEYDFVRSSIYKNKLATGL